MRHLLSLKDLSVKQIQGLLNKAIAFKTKKPSVECAGKSLVLIFSKRSTRTRLAAETGWTELGGNSIFLSPQDIQLGVNESIKDTAKVVSSMADLVLMRWNAHEEVEEFAKHSTKPVINGLTDLYHPTQILADLMTLIETKKDLAGLKVAWVGDANNMLNSYLLTFPRFGIEFRVATPRGYSIDARVSDQLKEPPVLLTNSPEEAVEGADVIITDTWISMGQEAEKKKRLEDFKGFQVNKQLLRGASKDWLFMHCLPRKQEEVDDEVFYSSRSLVFPEAENRKYTMMAVMSDLSKGKH